MLLSDHKSIGETRWSLLLHQGPQSREDALRTLSGRCISDDIPSVLTGVPHYVSSKACWLSTAASEFVQA